MADACQMCHGSLETWDGRRRWTCPRCTGAKTMLPARVSVPTFVSAADWPAYSAQLRVRR